MATRCAHSARWEPSFDQTDAYESPPLWVDGRFVAMPSVRGPQNASVGLCLLPKAASSRLKMYVFAALEMRGYPVGPDWNACPHRQRLPPVVAPPATAYLIVRHPLMRLASAWREITRRGFWHRLPRAVARRPNVTFELALRAIMATPPMALDLHLRPLLHMCGILGGRRYTILHYENWNATTRTLQAHFAPTLPPLRYRASGTLPRAHHLYSRSLAREANRFFEGDLVVGQYEKWMPGESVRWGPSHPRLRDDKLVQRLPSRC